MIWAVVRIFQSIGSNGTFLSFFLPIIQRNYTRPVIFYLPPKMKEPPGNLFPGILQPMIRAGKNPAAALLPRTIRAQKYIARFLPCLLYTSDAADEEDSV